MNRYDIIADRGRGSILFTKEVPTDEGKYIRFVDHEKGCEALKAQNKEMLVILVELYRYFIKTNSIMMAGMIKVVVEKITGKKIEEALKWKY